MNPNVDDEVVSLIPSPWAEAMVSAGLVDPRRREDAIPSLRQLAFRANVSVETVRRLVHGMGYPAPESMRRVADALGIDPGQVVEWVHSTHADIGPYQPPANADLLSKTERRAIDHLIGLFAEHRKELWHAHIDDGDGDRPRRPIHKLIGYDEGRFVVNRNGYTADEIADPIGLAQKLIPLLRSQDPEDRRDAARIIYLLRQGLCCPDGVWVVQTEYIPGKDGVRWSDRHITWSAHLTEAEADRWHAVWTERWAATRNDYGMVPVHQEDGVPLHYLKHPDADPKMFVQY